MFCHVSITGNKIHAKVSLEKESMVALSDNCYADNCDNPNNNRPK